MLPPLVADANIAYAVVEFLRSQDVDVLYVREEGWHHYEDYVVFLMLNFTPIIS